MQHKLQELRGQLLAPQPIAECEEGHQHGLVNEALEGLRRHGLAGLRRHGLFGVSELELIEQGADEQPPHVCRLREAVQVVESGEFAFDWGVCGADLERHVAMCSVRTYGQQRRGIGATDETLTQGRGRAKQSNTRHRQAYQRPGTATERLVLFARGRGSLGHTRRTSLLRKIGKDRVFGNWLWRVDGEAKVALVGWRRGQRVDGRRCVC